MCHLILMTNNYSVLFYSITNDYNLTLTFINVNYSTGMPKEDHVSFIFLIVSKRPKYAKAQVKCSDLRCGIYPMQSIKNHPR